MTITNKRLSMQEQFAMTLFGKLNIGCCGICGNYYMGNAYLSDGGNNAKPVSLAVTAELLCSIADERAPLDMVRITVTGPSGRMGTRKFSFDDLFGFDEEHSAHFGIYRSKGWNYIPTPEQMDRGISILNQYIDMFRACYGS